MREPPGNQREWMEVYRRRAALDPLRAVLDEGDPDNRKNAYVNAVEHYHVARALRGLRPAIAVDLGCGIGRFSGLLAARAAVVVGIDASEDLLRAAVRRFPSGKVRFARGDLRDLPLRTGTADLAFCCQVLLHLTEEADLSATAREVRRVLRPGGTALLLEHLAPGDESLRREGVLHRCPREFLAPFLATGLRPDLNRAIRKTPSRLVHWVRRRRLPRVLWGLAARFEPFFAGIGREPPLYREHLVRLRG